LYKIKEEKKINFKFYYSEPVLSETPKTKEFYVTGNFNLQNNVSVQNVKSILLFFIFVKKVILTEIR